MAPRVKMNWWRSQEEKHDCRRAGKDDNWENQQLFVSANN
jgi:hypothetical protein